MNGAVLCARSIYGCDEWWPQTRRQECLRLLLIPRHAAVKSAPSRRSRKSLVAHLDDAAMSAMAEAIRGYSRHQSRDTSRDTEHRRTERMAVVSGCASALQEAQRDCRLRRGHTTSTSERRLTLAAARAVAAVRPCRRGVSASIAVGRATADRGCIQSAHQKDVGR